MHEKKKNTNTRIKKSTTHNSHLSHTPPHPHSTSSLTQHFLVPTSTLPHLHSPPLYTDPPSFLPTDDVSDSG